MPGGVPAAGDLVWIRGRRWRVAGVRREDRVARLDVLGHDGRLTYLYPFDRPIGASPSTRPVRIRPQQAAARFAWLAGRTYGLRTLASAIDANAAILPHQLEPALAMLAGHGRMLIADEVGLGKTVQAGLVAAEIVRRDPASRLLVVVPATLVPQWIDELGRRFGLTCLLADRQALDRRAREGPFGASPWSAPGVWIASLDFLKQAHVNAAMPTTAWDLVVIDEAHGACGQSDRHRAADDLARRARRVVLLSATPHSGDHDRFERLLRLGRTESTDATDILVFRRRREDLGLARRRRVAWHGVKLSASEGQALDALAAFERAVLRATAPDGRDRAWLLLAVFRKRALSTMGALQRSLERRLAWLDRQVLPAVEPWAQPRLDFGDAGFDDLVGEEEREGLCAPSALAEDVERSWLVRVTRLVQTARRHESKVRRLVALAGRTGEPLAVFTEFRDSLDVLRDRFRLVRPLAVLHGGMTAEERAVALEAFQRGESTVLLATDVAGQGLNLHQRCRWVVSLELPWNPARLEQRIGRVDRIGQSKPVHATLLVARHDAEASLLAHLARRVLAARRSLGETTLLDVPPGEAAVRAALFDGHAIEPTPAPPIPASPVSWRRVATCAARHLERRRALVACWRGEDPVGRPAWTRGVRSTAVARAARGAALLVFVVPFVDRAGGQAEAHLGVVRVRAGADVEHLSPTTLPEALITAAGRLAVRSLQARLRRARRIRAAETSARGARERALADALGRTMHIGEAQPGLFDARAVSAFEAARTASDEIAARRDRVLARLRLQAGLDVGRPVLHLVILPS